MQRRLQAQRLVKLYGKKIVVDGVTLEVHAGEVVGILGPNGAGKTTTFYMLMGLIKPNQGKVFLNGEEVTGWPMYLRARKGISFLPQEPSVFRKLTVQENIMAILEVMDLSQEEREMKLASLLSELGITHVAKSKAYQLSGGERRRLEITRALVTSPSFILFDEPFTGIDPIAVADIQAIILKLKEKKIGILISDHNVRETLAICDRAYIISQGQILEEGTPEDIAQNPRVQETYLGENFRL
ncbi:MAG TPA: LPS export ABC transporter ATP-binding protein [Thermodesulfobacteriota bacterium]|nr:LPS export ABC transporter ATP-binding protein [Thermodesulfobacteriota bacterium]